MITTGNTSLIVRLAELAPGDAIKNVKNHKTIDNYKFNKS